MLHLLDAPLCVLPGDRMFQAQRILPGRARPVILHGYGGAKRDIPRTLPTIATEGCTGHDRTMLRRGAATT